MGPDDRLPLAAVIRGSGALAPAAACHVGRCVAEILVELHAVGGGSVATSENVEIDGGGAVRFVPSGGRVDPIADLHALGALVAECALGRPLGEGAGIRAEGAGLPERLVDAIEALTGPEDARLRAATAAVRMFAGMESLLGDGTAALLDALARMPKGPLRDTLPMAGQPAPRTVEMSRDAMLSLDDLRRIAPSPEAAAGRVPLPVAEAVIGRPVAQADVVAEAVAAPVARMTWVGLPAPRAEPVTKPMLPSPLSPSSPPVAPAESAAPHAGPRTQAPPRALLITAALLAVAVLMVLSFLVGLKVGARG